MFYRGLGYNLVNLVFTIKDLIAQWSKYVSGYNTYACSTIDL